MKKVFGLAATLIALIAIICGVLLCFNGCIDTPDVPEVGVGGSEVPGVGAGESEVPIDFTYSVNLDKTTCTIKGTTKTDVVDLVIPGKIDGYTVTTISPYAFNGSNIETVTLPDTIEMIEKGAFKNCKKLKSVHGLENCNGLKEIKADTFSCCEALQEISFPNTIESIGSSAFKECTNLRYVYGLENCTKLKDIQAMAFMSCEKLEKIRLPEGLEIIGKSAFQFCCDNLRNINIPSSVTLIGNMAFSYCLFLEEVKIPASVESIGNMAFYCCYSLEKINVDSKNPHWKSVSGVLYTKDMKTLHTFPSGKRCAEFNIPEGVTTIYSNAFSLPAYLWIIHIPSSVEKIGAEAISDAYFEYQLTIFYDGTIEMWNSIVKSNKWDFDTQYYAIYCTDGIIKKDGTVTYFDKQ